MKDSLYKNSIFLMASTGVTSVLGFLFWIIVARFFDSSEVGIATVIISVMGIIVAISSLGLNVAIIRFLPEYQNKSNKINTVFTLVTLFVIIISSIYILLIQFLTPDLLFIKENLFIGLTFIFFMVIAVLNHIFESIFIAFREAKYNLYRNIIYSISKVILPFIFIFFGFVGAYTIFSSWIIGILIGVIYCFYILIKKFNYKPSIVIYDSILKNIRGYSFDVYISGIILLIVSSLMPILVLNKLGPEQAAYYYIPMMIAQLLFTIPYSTANSFFAEGSFNEKKLKTLILNSIKIVGTLLLIANLFIFTIGDYILKIFGETYAIEGFGLLKLLAISSFIVAFNKFLATFLKIKKKTKVLIIINSIKGIILIILSLLFINIGIIGLGYAFLITQIVMPVLYVFYFYLIKYYKLKN